MLHECLNLHESHAPQRTAGVERSMYSPAVRPATLTRLSSNEEGGSTDGLQRCSSQSLLHAHHLALWSINPHAQAGPLAYLSMAAASDGQPPSIKERRKEAGGRAVTRPCLRRHGGMFPPPPRRASPSHPATTSPGLVDGQRPDEHRVRPWHRAGSPRPGQLTPVETPRQMRGVASASKPSRSPGWEYGRGDETVDAPFE